jgi:hypothetical protein
MIKHVTILRIFCVLLAVGLLAACSDDDQYTFSGDGTNRVYVNTGVHTLIDHNSYSFTVLHTPIGSLGNVQVSFPVTGTVEAGTDTKVTLAIDNTLAEAFNTRNGTSYKTLPDGYATISTPVATIARGAIASDPVTVSIPAERYASLQEAAYILPVRITAAEHAAVSADMNTVYIVVKTRITENLYDNPVAADTAGTRIKDRSAWTATLDVPFTTGGLATLFDGSTTSHIRVVPPQPCNLVVDLGSEYSNITGIRLHSQSATYAFRTITVWTSSDGTTWKSEGTATITATTVQQYMKFYATVTAQYIKLQITGWRSANGIRLAEFDLFAETL